ncbi:hypothetical protein OF83DRAFT_1285693 [Amylostereum chailletii]|nr:hypothetical protein OF83DRAFT_1285693 [Amylostereum chailletii]
MSTPNFEASSSWRRLCTLIEANVNCCYYALARIRTRTYININTSICASIHTSASAHIAASLRPVCIPVCDDPRVKYALYVPGNARKDAEGHTRQSKPSPKSPAPPSSTAALPSAASPSSPRPSLPTTAETPLSTITHSGILRSTKCTPTPFSSPSTRSILASKHVTSPVLNLTDSTNPPSDVSRGNPSSRRALPSKHSLQPSVYPSTNATPPAFASPPSDRAFSSSAIRPSQPAAVSAIRPLAIPIPWSSTKAASSRPPIFVSTGASWQAFHPSSKHSTSANRSIPMSAASAGAVEYLGSYHWINRPESRPTTVVPGAPPVWKAGLLVPFTVAPSSRPQYVDHNALRMPTAPFAPLFAGIDALATPVDWPAGDFVLDLGCLRRLMGWLDAAKEDEFRIDLELEGAQTVVMHRWEKTAIASFDIMVVRFKVDACIPKVGVVEPHQPASRRGSTPFDLAELLIHLNLEPSPSPPASPSHSTSLHPASPPGASSQTPSTPSLKIIRVGKETPHEALLALTARTRAGAHTLDWPAVLPPPPYLSAMSML